MIIQFYLNNEVKTKIISFYDMDSNPFSINDIINLKVNDIYPHDYYKFKKEVQVKIINENKEFQNLFSHKKIKLVKESKWIDFDTLNPSKFIIEYHCEFVD